ncbi:MAG TPA: DegT/DnrJ/EryC1/StrS family aminotransferase [Anaerolineaceae bacterium]|nr:DegT/DnrJ/EryC1/StrS family aminotransferase [Anaerolineaceae bacterium]
MTTSSEIAFVDLHAQHQPILAEINHAIGQILETSSFIGGKALAQFEDAFAQYLGVKDVIGVGNGTDALWLALAASGIGPDHAVITVPNTFIATVEAITRTGALPLFVDIDLETSTLSPTALQTFLEDECIVQENGEVTHRLSGKQVAAVLPVHLYGLPADLAAIRPLCERFGLALFEDACQAHGAEIHLDGKWQKAGSIGAAAAFSFYPGKNLGAIGDAGAVATNDPALAEKMRQLRNHGSGEKYIHTTHAGWNARLDALQAAVLSIKLKHLDEWNARRRQAAAWYDELLADLPVERPVEPADRKHVYHLYVIRTEERDRLRKALSDCGVETGIHYPIPLHRQQAYAWMALSEGRFPNAETSARTILSLPMHPYLTREQVERVSEACASILVGE